MGKFNTKHESVKPTVVNCMGEQAFKLNAKEELVSTVLTTFLQDSYYEKENEIVERIKNASEKVDPLFVAKLALYARNEGNLRSVTHLLSSVISKRISGQEWGKRFYDKIVVRPDDISEILSAYAVENGMDLKNIRKIPNAMKKGFKSALERFDAYQIDKYKMNKRELSLIDIVNLLHPSPTQKNQEAYKRLIENKSLSDLYSSKILEKEMSQVGKKVTEDKTASELKEEAITEVLSNVKGMPLMNLIRNLRNIIKYAPSQVDEACRQMTIPDKVLKSRLLPFRFATAYSEVESMTDSYTTKSAIQFEEENKSDYTFSELKQKVLIALEKAIEISCQNIPKLDGNVAILVDHSGSVRGDGGGSSKVSAFSKTTTAMIGNLFATMLTYAQDNVYIGLFGDRLIPVKIDRNKGILKANRDSFEEGAKCGGGTETGIYDFLRLCINEKKKVDNLVVFSDCQIGSNASTSWYGRYRTDRSLRFQELFKEFKKINPLCNVIVVDIRQTKGNNVFHKSQRILNIAGWSTNIFDVIKSNCKGYDALIKEIEKIEI